VTNGPAKRPLAPNHVDQQRQMVEAVGVYEAVDPGRLPPLASAAPRLPDREHQYARRHSDQEHARDEHVGHALRAKLSR
jgi:hypothetical protein